MQCRLTVPDAAEGRHPGPAVDGIFSLLMVLVSGQPLPASCPPCPVGPKCRVVQAASMAWSGRLQ